MRAAEFMLLARSMRAEEMSMSMINRSIKTVNWPHVIHSGCCLPAVLCRASLQEWEAFVASEDQALHSTYMEWDDGHVLLVELPSRAHEHLVRCVTRTFTVVPVVSTHLRIDELSILQEYDRFQPDATIGPLASRLCQLSIQPGNQHAYAFDTLKLEVGVSRGWGHAPGLLDWKATHWTAFPGVAYVLCIAADRDLRNCSYKLHEVVPNMISLPSQNATAVIAPATLVHFDARTLLGIHSAKHLPRGFPDPITIDLFAALERARRDLAPWYGEVSSWTTAAE